MINGIVFGLSLGLMSSLFWNEPATLGLLVGAAFAMNTLIAVSLGGLIPLLLRRFKIDPALGAPPILTTLTDMCGFLLVLGFARLAIETGFI